MHVHKISGIANVCQFLTSKLSAFYNTYLDINFTIDGKSRQYTYNSYLQNAIKMTEAETSLQTYYLCPHNSYLSSALKEIILFHKLQEELSYKSVCVG